MIHRALLGTLDRFMGILLEHYKDKFPVWLSPLQVKVLSITEKQNAYAMQVAEELDTGNIVSQESKIESFVENVVKIVKEDGVSRAVN